MWRNRAPKRGRRGRSQPTRTAGGMVTAEAAVVLPLVALMALSLIWMLSVGIADVRVVDAARDAARTLARGDATPAAVRSARRTAGPGAAVRIARRGGFVAVSVSRRISPPRWLLLPLPAVTVRSESSVEIEDDERS